MPNQREKSISTQNLSWSSHYKDVKDSYIHYLDEGEGDPVVFLHGNPTSGYLWRNIFPYLTMHARCIVPDLIGMGKSGKPNGTYRFEEHYSYIETFIEALELKNITLVLHDWGSALGFQYMHYHPEKIKKVAFMEAFVKSWRWKSMKWSHRWGFRLLRTPLVGELMIYFMDAFINFIMPQLILRRLTKEEKQAYKAPFRKIRNRKPMLVWPREIPINRKPSRMHRNVSRYWESFCISDYPKLLIYAHPGIIINKRTLKHCQKHIRNLQTKYIGEGLHFIQEDQPEAIGEALREWYLEEVEK